MGLTYQNVWNKIADDYHVVSKLSKPHDDKFEIVANTIISENAKDVLDLGAGSGLLEQKLVQKGFNGRVEALDLSEEMIRIAKSELAESPGIRFQKADLNYPFPYKKNSFDIVVAINLLFLIDNQSDFIRQVCLILKPKGKFILINPKPRGSIKAFVKSNLKQNNRTNYKLVLRLIKKIKPIIRVILYANWLDRQEKKRKINYFQFNEITEVLKKNDLFLLKAMSIQADQNWLFVALKK